MAVTLAKRAGIITHSEMLVRSARAHNSYFSLHYNLEAAGHLHQFLMKGRSKDFVRVAKPPFLDTGGFRLLRILVSPTSCEVFSRGPSAHSLFL